MKCCQGQGIVKRDCLSVISAQGRWASVGWGGTGRRERTKESETHPKGCGQAKVVHLISSLTSKSSHEHLCRGNPAWLASGRNLDENVVDQGVGSGAHQMWFGAWHFIHCVTWDK